MEFSDGKVWQRHLNGTARMRNTLSAALRIGELIVTNLHEIGTEVRRIADVLENASSIEIK